VGEAAVEIGGRTFDLHDVVAITAPGPFPGWGIGGILSPQHLLPAAWAVLDLADDLFVLLDGDEAHVVAWLTARQPALRLHRLARVPGDGTILVIASVEPFGEVVTMLDSGGKRTTFAASAVPGLGGGPMASSGRGVGGTESIGSEVRDQVLRVGGVGLPLASLIVGDEMDGRSGLVGMDVLRGTVLTVSGDPDRPVLWQTP
jgi:hypothetical protein